MRSRLTVLLLLLLALGAGLWFASRRGPAPETAPVSEPDEKVEPPPVQAVTETFRLPLPPPPSEAPPPEQQAARGEPASARALRASNPPPPEPLTEDPAQTEAEAIALNIRQFMLRFGANPVGTNAEIVKELNGGNAKNARYLPPDLLRLNDQGELIDRWGTPYFFHQESATKMEVRSAGPDRQLYTTDDYIAR